MRSSQNLFFLLVLLVALTAPRQSRGQLKTIAFEEVTALQKVDKRPMVVFIHTDWCRYCNGMKKTTFRNEKVVQLLQENFYFLDLNAEEERPIRFLQQTFRFKPKGHNTGTHELAEQLGSIDGKLSFPMLCFLNADYEIIYQHPGFIDAPGLVKILEHLQKTQKKREQARALGQR